MFDAMSLAAIGAYTAEIYGSRKRDRPPSMLPYSQPPAPRQSKSTHIGKCECCGSREFVNHDGMVICGYCRAGQERNGGRYQIIGGSSNTVSGNYSGFYSGISASDILDRKMRHIAALNGIPFKD